MSAKAKTREFDVTARADGDKWAVTVGQLDGTTTSRTVSGVARAARDHAYLSGIPRADDATYNVHVELPVDDEFRALVEQARDRTSEADVRRTAARRLRDELGFTGSDISVVLGFTHQWVSMLLDSEVAPS